MAAEKYDEADFFFHKALDTDPANSSHTTAAFLCDRGKLDAGVRHFDVAAGDALYSYTAEVNLNAGVWR
jgi:Tfp pilus assembly protein PilF